MNDTAQLGKLDVYSERAIDVYVECQNFKTTPKSPIDVYRQLGLLSYVRGNFHQLQIADFSGLQFSRVKKNNTMICYKSFTF